MTTLWTIFLRKIYWTKTHGWMDPTDHARLWPGLITRERNNVTEQSAMWRGLVSRMRWQAKIDLMYRWWWWCNMQQYQLSPYSLRRNRYQCHRHAHEHGQTDTQWHGDNIIDHLTPTGWVSPLIQSHRKPISLHFNTSISREKNAYMIESKLWGLWTDIAFNSWPTFSPYLYNRV